MKTFFALLLIGIIAYVECDPDECDQFAANTYDKPKKENSEEHLDQTITLDDFVKHKQMKYFVTKATPSGITGSDTYCTAPTHGDGCKSVGYWRHITEFPPEKSQKGANLLKFNTEFVAVNKHKFAIKYKMTIKGKNEDDYIFIHDETTEITATRIDENGNEIANVTKEIATGVIAVLRSKFALFYAKNGFALYMTCDAKSMWVSYDSAVVAAKEIEKTKDELQGQIEKLQDRVRKAGFDVPALVDVSPEMDDEFEKHIPQVAAAA